MHVHFVFTAEDFAAIFACVVIVGHVISIYVSSEHAFHRKHRVTFIALVLCGCHVFISGQLCMPDREFVCHNTPIILFSGSMICFDVIV